jgi:Leishmanolysin/Bacterial Ig-like domain (group 1)
MRKLLIVSGLTLLAWGCKDGGGTPSQVATTVTMSPGGAIGFDAVGATQVVHAIVTDQNGKPMPGASIAWSSSAAGVTVAGAGGDSAVVTAAANGSATITASAGTASATLGVQVAQVAASMQKLGGDAQTGAAGVALGTPLRMAVRDRLGAGVAGATVSFTVVGGGSVTPGSAVSGADGTATVNWTLGTQAGTTQLVMAATSGLSAAVEFSATAVAGPPASAAMGAGDDQVAATGAAVAVAPRVTVRDAFQNPVAGVAVQFTPSGASGVTGGSQTTDANGVAVVGSWVLGSGPGVYTLAATFPGTSLPAVVFTARAGNPGSISIGGGNNQAAMAGSAVPTVPTVLVRDGSGNPLPGQSITFTVTSGGGTVGSATVTSNAQGVASPGSWTLGATAGPNTLTATAPGLAAAPVAFRGIGCSGGGPGYTLTLCFTTAMTASQRAAFENAADRWGDIITGDVPDISGSVPAGACGGAGAPSMNHTFDDLVIFAGIEYIDGPGAVLGSAGPCYVRDPSYIPLLGVMRFDLADVQNLEQAGSFGFVILHEMGHVLGIGTIWNAKGLLQDPSGSVVRDTYFSGANAIAAFDAIGGSTYTAGQKVPVENTGGPGTANGHWRETVLGRELMTGYLNSGSNPLSVLTARSLTDLGYTVNASAADAFSLTLMDGASLGGLRLHNDIYTGPLYRMSRQGRVTRIRN